MGLIRLAAGDPQNQEGPVQMKEDWIEKSAGAPRWFRFTYLVPGREDRELRPFQTRDDAAALALHDALFAGGYRFGGYIYNYPAKPQPPIKVDDSFLRPQDLLVLTTRPPLHDWDDGDRNRVHRSHTTLEEKVFTCIKRHLTHCSRSKVTVSDTHARAWSEVARMVNVQFRLKRGAKIDAVMTYGSDTWQRDLASTPTTVAYLIFEAHAWEGGPGLLVSFGMSGTDTLAWNFILATQYPELIASVPFVMAEITAEERPARPQTLEFLRHWQIRLLTPYAPAPYMHSTAATA